MVEVADGSVEIGDKIFVVQFGLDLVTKETRFMREYEFTAETETVIYLGLGDKKHANIMDKKKLKTHVFIDRKKAEIFRKLHKLTGGEIIDF
jgi:hypothetical protein